MGNPKFLSTLTLFLVSLSGYSQVIEPATWSHEVSAQSAKVGEEIDLIFKAEIDPDWYLYSSDFECEIGPMLTTFTFEESDTYALVGGIQPIGAKEKYDEIFECDYTYFRLKGEFRQKIKVLKPGLVVNGNYEYQVCTDIDGKCIPFEEEFVFDKIEVTAAATPGKPANDERAQRPEKTNEQKDEVAKEDKKVSPEAGAPAISHAKQQATEKEPPVSDTKDQYADAEPQSSGQKDNIRAEESSTATVVKEEDEIPMVNMEPFFDKDYQQAGQESYWLFMLAAFLAGLAALLTPCVFPMIPMTVTFFTGGETAKSGGGVGKALFYGISIILIYTLIGSLVAPLMGPETANDLATEWLPNMIFFAVFVFFALSFFGMYDIVLPSRFVNKMDQQADKGGLIGVFFMAFTLVLVSFSCTGPIVGTILVESAGGEVLKPILGMLAFSLAFAIPFTMFAIFPGWLSSLPKSGGWLNSVKVVLGFLELALAFKFLSIADQAFHWGILDREVNIAIWVVIFSLMGFYLLGKIKLPHDSELKHISVPRLLLAIITFSFVIYLVPGMFGAPLKPLAGYLPPMHTHDFDMAGIIRDSQPEDEDTIYDNCDDPKYADFLHLPHGIKGYFDYEQALACGRAQDKPIFVDFTGHGCTNCREMEAAVWSDPRVLEKLKNDFVVVALYVDDKTTLPESEWYVSAYDNKVKKSIGKQNADLQIQRANNNAQPNYFVIGHDEKALTSPISYSKVDEFVNFLDEGLKNFRTPTLASKR